MLSFEEVMEKLRALYKIIHTSPLVFSSKHEADAKMILSDVPPEDFLLGYSAYLINGGSKAETEKHPIAWFLQQVSSWIAKGKDDLWWEENTNSIFSPHPNLEALEEIRNILGLDRPMRRVDRREGEDATSKRCPECRVTGGNHTLSCSKVAHRYCQECQAELPKHTAGCSKIGEEKPQ